MLVVETLVSLVEHSLLCEPAPVPAFQLVLSSVGAGPGTSRSAVADVLTESAAASIFRHIACAPLNVQPEAVLEELAEVWAALGPRGGSGGPGGGGGDPDFAGGRLGRAGGSSRAFMGFGLNRVVPLDPLVVFVAVTGGGSLEERANAAFWTLDRDGAGYLTLQQLLRLSGMLMAVAAAGRIVLNLPPLPRGAGHLGDSPLIRAAGGGGGPSSAHTPGAALRPQQPQPPGLSPDAGLPLQAPGPDGGGGAGTAAGGGGQPQPPAPPSPATAAALAAGPSPAGGLPAGGAASASATAAGDESRVLLDAALVGAFHEHCLPAEGPNGPPARLTDDRMALVIKSAAEYITMAVVHRATAAHAGDGGPGHLHGYHPSPFGTGLAGPFPHPHYNHHHQLSPHHVSRLSFGSGTGSPMVWNPRSPAHSQASFQHHHVYHQRQHSMGNSTYAGGVPPSPMSPPAAPPILAARPPRPLPATSASAAAAAATAAATTADGSVVGGGDGYIPTASQPQLNQRLSYGSSGGTAVAAAAAAATVAAQMNQVHSQNPDGVPEQAPVNAYLGAGGVPCAMYGDGGNPHPSTDGGGGGASIPGESGNAFARGSAVADAGLSQSKLRHRSVNPSSTAAVQAWGAARGTPSTAGNGLRPSSSSSPWGWAWTWGWAGSAAAPPAVAAGRGGGGDGSGDRQAATTAAVDGGGAAVTQRPSSSWVGGSLWAATSYIGGAIWGTGRTRPAAGPSAGGPAAGPATGAAAATASETDFGTGTRGAVQAPGYPPRFSSSGLGLSTPEAMYRGHTATASAVAAAAATAVVSAHGPVPTPTRGSHLDRVSEHPDLPDSPQVQSPVRQSGAFPTAAAVTPSSAGSGRPGVAATGGSPLGGAPGPPSDGTGGGGGSAEATAGRGAAAATAEVSSLLATDTGPALLAALSEAADKSTRAGAVGGGAPTGPNPSRTVSGLFNRWRRPSRPVATAGDAAGSPGQGAASAAQSTGGAATPAQAAYLEQAQNAARDGVGEDGLVAAFAAASASACGRRRTPVLQGFSAAGAGTGDGSVHGGGLAGGGAAATGPPPSSRTLGGGLDSHFLLSSLAHAPHSLEEAVTRAEVAAKAEAAAAATRGGAAAATAGGGAGGREAAAGPASAGGAARAGGGGTVLPPLQRAIRSSVQQAGVKLCLHCGVCLLAIIALLLLDAALVAWIYLDRKQRLSQSLVIVAATNTGLVLLVMIITIVRSCMTDRAAALEAAAARQASQGGHSSGGGGAGGVLGFLLGNFVTPMLQTMGIIRGPEDAANRSAAPGTSGQGGHEGGGWGSRLRMLWTTIGRVAGFDASPDEHGIGPGAGGPGTGVHGGLPLLSSDYMDPHVALDLEAGPGGGGGVRAMPGGGGGGAGVAAGVSLGGAGGSIQLSSSPYSPNGRALGGVGSPFLSVGMGFPEAGMLMGGEPAGAGGGAAAAAGPRAGAASSGTAALAGDPRVSGGYQLTGTAARDRTRGVALPTTYYSSVSTQKRVEAAYPPL